MDEFLRWTNFALAAAGLLWLAARSYLRWDEYPYTIRLFLLTLGFYVVGVAYGAAEAALQDAFPLGARVFFYLAGNLALMATLALTQKRRTITMRG